MFREWKNNDMGVFEDIEKEIEEMNKIMNKMMNSIDSSPGVYGFSLQVGPDGVQHMERFGNIKPAISGLGEITEVNVREPFVSSIVDEKNNVLNVTAEMPGLQKRDIELSATENEVIIKTTGKRKYYKVIPAPCPVNPDSAKAKYNNGLLELTLELMDAIKPDGKSINIE
jgi:HSP20 family protein